MAKRKPFRGSGKASICDATSRKGKRRWWQLFWKQWREENNTSNKPKSK